MRQAVAVKANIDHLLGHTDGRENKAQELSLIHIFVRGMSISLEALPLVLQRLRDGTSGHSVQKSEDGGKEEN